MRPFKNYLKNKEKILKNFKIKIILKYLKNYLEFWIENIKTKKIFRKFRENFRKFKNIFGKYRKIQKNQQLNCFE